MPRNAHCFGFVLGSAQCMASSAGPYVIYVYMHARIPTCIHTYIHTYIHDFMDSPSRGASPCLEGGMLVRMAASCIPHIFFLGWGLKMWRPCGYRDAQRSWNHCGFTVGLM